jgi:telomerase reverse transcriptase
LFLFLLKRFQIYVLVLGSLPFRYLQQHTGIPQGSIMGSLLCSAFYADMEATHALGAAAAPRPLDAAAADGALPQSVLVRWIDDFLFLSVCPDAAAAFVARVHAGFPDYGAAVSASKTALNFDAVDAAGAPLPRNEYCPPGGGGGGGGPRYLRWCGLLLNSETLEARADYSRYEGELVRDGVALPPRAPGGALRQRLRSFIRPKAVFIERPSPSQGPGTQRNIVFLRTRKIVQGGRKLLGRHHAQIRLHSALKPDTGFCRTVGDHVRHERMTYKKLGYLLRTPRRD